MSIIGILLVILLLLRRYSPGVPLVSAGAPEPWFSDYTRAIQAMHQLEDRIYPIANWITLALFVLGLVLAFMVGYWLTDRIWFAMGIFFVVADQYPYFRTTFPPRPAG